MVNKKSPINEEINSDENKESSYGIINKITDGVKTGIWIILCVALAVIAVGGIIFVTIRYKKENNK